MQTLKVRKMNVDFEKIELNRSFHTCKIAKFAVELISCTVDFI